ncbi:MAG: PrsW family intramembrane metalloprotease [Chitinophagales bacterium]|jgi:RsiW-degrading membrane proteinase PrsW (M82 family)|nr:PrsW family intramembrane metalloprotease [Chitinophagales bacterium]
MYALVPLALAIAPGVGIAFYIYWKDTFDKEPRKLLIRCFLLGIFSILPAIILEYVGFALLPVITFPITTFINAFFVIGLSEEFSKFLMLRFYAFPKKEFNEPFDGITYSVMVGMGFATLENILYVDQHGMTTGVFRMFTAIPAHASFAVIMGYYMGLSKFRSNPLPAQMLGLLLAVMLHGAYDFCLMVNSVPLIWLGAILSLILGVRYSLKAIHLHQIHSPFNIIELRKKNVRNDNEGEI